MIKLYGVPRSRTMRVIWMLEELEVPYENIKTNFATGETRQPEYLKINPNGHIPTLQDGDVTLWESMAINLYLARKYDKGLWPRTLGGEGNAFKWSFWAMTEAEEPILTAMLYRAFLPEAQRDQAKADDAAKRAETPLRILDGELTGKEYLVDNTFSVADLNVASLVGLAAMGGIDLGKFPNVAAWMGRCTSRPGYGRAMSKMQ